MNSKPGQQNEGQKQEPKITGARSSLPYKNEKEKIKNSSNNNNVSKYSEEFRSARNLQVQLNKYILEKTTDIEKTNNTYKKLNILAGILKEIKEEFQGESHTRRVLGNKTNWEQYADKPIYKILRYFRNQVIVRKYIKYSIEYITLLQLILTPENLKRLQLNLELLQTETNQPGEINNKQDNDFKYIAEKIEREYSDKSLRDIIISMLNDYDINYNGGESDRDLMMKLKLGVRELMDFVVSSIDSAPTALHLLTKLPIIDEIKTDNE